MLEISNEKVKEKTLAVVHKNTILKEYLTEFGDLHAICYIVR